MIEVANEFDFFNQSEHNEWREQGTNKGTDEVEEVQDRDNKGQEINKTREREEKNKASLKETRNKSMLKGKPALSTREKDTVNKWTFGNYQIVKGHERSSKRVHFWKAAHFGQHSNLSHAIEHERVGRKISEEEPCRRASDRQHNPDAKPVACDVRPCVCEL